jgi:2-aminoadipate transaminase
MNAPTDKEIVFASRMAQLRPSAIREILKTTEAPDVISFAGGLPAPELFPTETFQVAARTILSGDSTGALQYGVTEGYTPLREWLSGYLNETVGLRVKAGSVLITQGSQQGLDLLAKVLLDPGDVVLVETPAYLGALQAFQSYQAKVVGLASDEEGLRADLLEQALSALSAPPKFLYLICNYQNPTGTSMSAARRQDIAEIAARHNLLVVEDDPYGRLRFEGGPERALGAQSKSGPWAYLGSTSKILAPGLRVGWVATSHAGLFERLVTAKQATDLQTGSFTQRLVFALLNRGEWLDQHIANLCEVYRKRRDVMLQSLESQMPEGTHWTRPSGGLFLWVTLPRETTDTLSLLRRAASHQVAFVPGAPFCVGQILSNALRLNFSNASEENIRKGIRRLGGLVRSES